MAVLDVLTLDEAKLALNLIPPANTTQDVEVASYVSAVSLAMDRRFGPIVQRSVADEAHDGGGLVFLRRYPVASVTTVTERIGATATVLSAENFAALTANDYQLDTSTGILTRRSGGISTGFAAGSQNVRVTYVAGRFTATTTVDQRFKQGAAMMLSHLWRPEQGIAAGPFGPEGSPVTGAPGWAVPRAVLQLLADELQAPASA